MSGFTTASPQAVRFFFLSKTLEKQNHRTEVKSSELMNSRSLGLPNWSSDIQRVASNVGNKSKLLNFGLLS